ncbi:MAG: SAM-dependent DNA methyltransferase [Bacteroidetes bacterium]|nr:SAM-dependent DNA methyltransferase [Bacteroidota bacterium]
MKKSANERTFQGRLFIIAERILDENKNIGFHKITQEENTGTTTAKFSDGIIYSNIDASKKVYIELKNASWDASDDELVMDAANKANMNGAEYFITGTPRQLIIFQTFKPNTTLQERKLKIYTLSNVKKDDDILLPSYERDIIPKLKIFLQELSDIVHGIKEVTWDTIDKFFVNRLSNYILEASAAMIEPMYLRLSKEKKLQKRLREYLTEQDIFNVTFKFDNSDVYNICQLSNYLLFLKLIFYTYLQRDVPELKLKPIIIPNDKKLLNKTLRKYFDDVLQHDFEKIFSENILDEFEFEERYLPVLRQNVEQISHLNFNDLNADIIGAIYNTLIDNQEQHDRGQHFTNTNEVDIVNAFCIKLDTKLILDSGCGAGTFLVRAYHFLKFYNPKITHEQLLERLWGVEIAAFPAFLATMNLSLQSVKTLDNYPTIIQSDFSKVESNSHFNLMFLNANKSFKVKNLDGKRKDVAIPVFDACVGNPPYIRQELIQHKQQWNELALKEFGLKKINQQSDLYVYYLMHTAAFLREGGRLGYVISSSWLDVSFGTGLQKFLLEHFKIIAIIDHQSKRSFDTASINTVILILEKCSDANERFANNIRFVKVTADYEKLLGNYNDNNRVKQVEKWADEIENLKQNTINADYSITIVNQQELEEYSTSEGKYENGNWGARYFRSPAIYHKIISASKGKLFSAKKFIDVKRGFTSGANEFFYLLDETESVLNLSDNLYKLQFGIKQDADIANHKRMWDKFGWYYSEMNQQHYIIERFYTQPIFKSQKEAHNLDVDLSQLKFSVIICNDNKNKLSKFKNKILKYIEDAEEKDIYKRESLKDKKIWYDLLPNAVVGDFIFPSKVGEKFRLIDNRDTKVFCDKVSYAMTVIEEYKEYSDTLFLLMNSISFRFLFDLFARQLTGSQTLSDVDVNVIKNTLLLNPSLLRGKEKELAEIMQSLKSREQSTIFEEIHQQDRRKLDILIFEALGLTAKDVDELYFEACKYIQDRKEKSSSVITKKSKGKLSDEDAIQLISERFSEIRSYASLIEREKTRSISIPDWDAKYAKANIGMDNLFGHYDVYFKQGNNQQKLSFTSKIQLNLFRFLNETIDIKGQKINLPEDDNVCIETLKTLKEDFDANFEQMKSLLKSHRSKANAISIYRSLLFS